MFANRALECSSQEAENRGQVEFDHDLVLKDVNATVDLLPGSRDKEVHPVFIWPLGFHSGHTSGKVVADFMGMGVHSATHFLATKLVRQGNLHFYRWTFVAGVRSGSGTPVSGMPDASSRISSPPKR